MESFFAALGLAFVAEIGDKTQIVAMAFAARHSTRSVVAGLALAFAATNLLSVVAGALLGAALPTRWIGIVGGLLFIGFALWTLRGEPEADDTAGETVSADGRTALVTASAAVFVAELGDKTMLATATLAANGNPVTTWAGATLGMTLAGALGVFFGRVLGAHLPERVTRIGAACLFAGFGVALVVMSVW